LFKTHTTLKGFDPLQMLTTVDVHNCLKVWCQKVCFWKK